jgi:hypothetical protein
VLTWAVALLASTVPVAAADVDPRLDVPALREDPRVQRLVRLEREVDRTLALVEALERRIGRASLAYVEAARLAETAGQAVAEAQQRLDDRIRTAYEMGPGATLEALLGAPTFADLGTIAEYTSRVVSLDRHELHEVARAQVVAVSLRARAEAELAALTPRLRALQDTLDALRPKLDRATLLAERARVHHERLQEQRRALAEATLRAETWEDLRTLAWREDQAPFLALLGPTGGQTCDTPPGLVETGESFSGYASWYGWEFGGQPTAMGAIFDPRLFTAANRWLPLGSFLRVRNGDRCAIVLVNDRGPYGRLERVIDLSQAAAQYLGVGVSWVDAEVLVVAPPV